VPDVTLPPLLALSLPTSADPVDPLPKSSHLTRLSKLLVTQRGAAVGPVREELCPCNEEDALSSSSSSPAASPQTSRGQPAVRAATWSD